MNIKESLLNGSSFHILLQQFSLHADDIKIQNEDMLLLGKSERRDVVKEDICIEGKNEKGAFNLFGVLHYNLLNELAVFEMQGYERIN